MATTFTAMATGEIRKFVIDFVGNLTANETVASFTTSAFSGGAGNPPILLDSEKSGTEVRLWVSTRTADAAGALTDLETWEFTVTAVGSDDSPTSTDSVEVVRAYAIPIQDGI